MYRLGSCIPILRVFFLLKVQKRCVYVNILFLVLILVENVFIGLKKGISKNAQGSCKTYCFLYNIAATWKKVSPSLRYKNTKINTTQGSI